MSRIALLVHLTALVVSAASSFGCVSWRVETEPPAELIARKHPSRIRVETADGRRQVLNRPVVSGDTLRGQTGPNTGGPYREVAIADVTSVSTSHFSVGRTAGLAAGAGAVLLTVAVISLASWDGPLGGCCQ